eukprot:s1353_g25.t1
MNIVAIKIFRCMSARQRAAAISGTPVTSSCFRTLRGWSTSFLAGIIATVLCLELTSNMTDTPPHVSDAESELPPPTAGFAAFLEFSGQTTLGQLVATTLDLNPREPGLLRLIAGNAAEISVTATVSDLEWPKHLYVQCSSYSEYKRVAPIFATLEHSPYQDRQVQYDNNRLTEQRPALLAPEPGLKKTLVASEPSRGREDATRWRLAEFPAFDDFGFLDGDFLNPDHVTDYEPSISDWNLVGSEPSMTSDSNDRPVAQSDSSWKRFAQSKIVSSDAKRLKSSVQLNPQSLMKSFGASPSDQLSALFSLPDSSLKVLEVPLKNFSESPEQVAYKERILLARRVRLTRSDDDLRDASVAKLQKLMLIDPQATRLGDLLAPMDAKPMTELEVRVTLEIKEYDVYSYLNHLDREKAGATASSGFIEALRFLDGIAIFTHANLEVVLSPRVTGLAHQLFMQKKPLQQKDPLPCKIVKELEALLVRKQDDIQVVILGQLLWCFHSGSRWSDAMRLKSLKLEKQETVSLIVGDALGSKTSTSKESKTHLIPYVAIGSGISALNWGELWLDARTSQLGRDPEPFLPTFSCRTGKWGDTPMSSTEATGYLVDFITEVLPLMGDGYKINLKALGTHSLKTGLLTMASRSTNVQFSLSDRRVLGHHIAPGDRSALTYSREAYTALYGKVLACFRDIQNGFFDPDASPLSRILEAADHLAEGKHHSASHMTGELQVEGTEEICEISSESSEEAFDLVEVCDDGSQKPKRCPFPASGSWECIVHKKSGIVHCLQSSTFTFCGRPYSANYVKLDEAIIEDMECCILCGKQLGAGVE